MVKKQNSRCQADEEYKPRNQTKSESQKKNSSVVQNPLINSSKWSIEQNKKFLNFLKLNMGVLSCPLRRKEQKVFLQLSKAILTRTPDQCRSHHQKMIKHHNDFDGIITHLERINANFSTSCQLLQDFQNSEIEQEKNQRVEHKFFCSTLITVEIEQEYSQKSIWDVLDEYIWTSNPVQLTNGF